MWKKMKPYLVSILIALAVGGLSALLTRGNMDVYERINVPPLAPPMWLFPVAWGILYVLMGIGAARIYTKNDETPLLAHSALYIYALQLGVNFLWSIIFFNLQAYWVAFFWLLLLWALILRMILRFYKVDPVAAYLQIPYLLWVSFAGYLTLAIAILN